MSAKVFLLAAAATAADPERKRQAGRAERKSGKNQARYLLNLVAETAGASIDGFTAAELLEAARMVAELTPQLSRD